jgi:hypothetical protein
MHHVCLTILGRHGAHEHFAHEAHNDNNLVISGRAAARAELAESESGGTGSFGVAGVTD